jgi:hypothetical protein
MLGLAAGNSRYVEDVDDAVAVHIQDQRLIAREGGQDRE